MREVRLEDPDFEPSDEDLVGLSKRAFAHVAAEHVASLERMREEIAVLRRAALQRLHERQAAARKVG